MSEPVTGRMKIALGIIFPLVAFLVFDVVLLRSVAGHGEDVGFAGMMVYFRSFILVPLVLFGNALLMRRDWKSRSAVLLVGFIAPTIAGVYEFVSIYGAHRPG
jgi:hypothetical protein